MCCKRPFELAAHSKMHVVMHQYRNSYSYFHLANSYSYSYHSYFHRVNSYSYSYSYFHWVPGSVENGLGYKVVTSLVSQYKYQGYTIYMDYFYLSPALFKDLVQTGFNACGTLQTNKRHHWMFKNKTLSTGKITILQDQPRYSPPGNSHIRKRPRSFYDVIQPLLLLMRPHL